MFKLSLFGPLGIGMICLGAILVARFNQIEG